ncbi:MAG: FHA domain-containing protein [Candidatus Marinimicrobia bacterium]|jgi:pSer/pThr/pTyr-binding forkhead associated (FHA) protein|nr:FHA domain-containing protein [Candidatus Neomarinimicrobiota bacterium]MBT7114328.1 FHA domain-containing protein [Candidatus Neomarinimicrobiota bacterium]
MAKNQKTCSNGHIYEASEDNCPYCPSTPNQAGGDSDETVLDSGGPQADNKATAQWNPSDKLTGDMPVIDLSKTAIHKATDADHSSSSAGRKLIGWLVTFSSNPDGDDYQIREGKTTIGAAHTVDIHLMDNEVSSLHATVLYRQGVLRIKDEFSTNGTQVNDEDVVEATVLKDGDEIKIGKSLFKLRIIK